MSTCFFFQSSFPLAVTRQKVDEAKKKYGDILNYFWISQGVEATPFDKEDAAEYGMEVRSTFLIEWNKERSELMQFIPKIFYEIFGNDKVLVRNNDYDVIPPP
jgi:hypothetical protein